MPCGTPESISTWRDFAADKLSGIHSLKESTESKITDIVKAKLIKHFKIYWNELRDNTDSGKLSTYFKIKEHFNMEKYLMLNQFTFRRAMCRLRISAHDLSIEAGCY